MKRSLIIAMVLAVLAAQLAVSAVAAKGPPNQGPAGGGEPQGDSRILPLNAAQQTSRNRKEQIIAAMPGATTGGQATPLACPTSAYATSGREGESTAQASCGPPYQFTLAAHPRQQEKWYYCGPAVVQVVSNFTWGRTTTNKYSQTYISTTWTKTDATLQTYLADFIKGMNGASVLPAGFAYMQKHNPTFTDWHNTIIAGIYTWRMPLATSVRPHDPGATYWIISWPVAKSAAHYIGLFGYRGYAYTANSDRKVYYTDTAGQFAAPGVKAGNFWDISFDVYQTMMANNGNMVY